MVVNTAKRQELTLDQVRQLAPSAFTEAPHDSRSMRYQHISTASVMEKMLEEGFYPVDANQQKVRKSDRMNHTRHVIRFRHRDNNHADVVKVGDTFPEVVLLNSHDGSSAYKLMLGLFRLVCANGMIVGDNLCGVHVRHKGNIHDKVIEGAYEVIEKAPLIGDRVNRWSSVELSDHERRQFGQGALRVMYGDQAVSIDPDQITAPRRYQDDRNDLWTMFNRVQENAIRGGIRYNRPPGSRRRTGTTRQIRGVTRDIDLNRKLWSFTEMFVSDKELA